MRFDRKKFFDAYRKEFGKLNALQVDGLNRLLNAIESDPFITQIPEAAYLLATPKHETAHTFQPIHEYGGKSYFIRRYGGQTRKGRELGNDTPEEGYFYAGKGDVQLTGESNYEKAEVAIRREYPEVVADFERRTGKIFDLTIGDQANDTLDPQNALDPAISYAVMSYGMRTGMFTGRKLSEFIRRGKKDYVEARRTVNGKDKAQTIAGYAKKFEAILNASKISAVASNGDSAATENQTSATETPALNPSVQQPTNLVEQTVVATEGDTVTATTTTEGASIDMSAPVKDGATASSTKMVIAGFTIPPVIAGVLKAISDGVEQGYVSAAEIGSFLLTFLRDNVKWVLGLIGLIILLQIVKKIMKGLTFLFSLLTAAIPGWNTVNVIPADVTPKRWYQFWK